MHINKLNKEKLLTEKQKEKNVTVQWGIEIIISFPWVEVTIVFTVKHVVHLKFYNRHDSVWIGGSSS